MGWLIEASLRGSALILLGLLARSWGKTPRQALSWLWTAAALRLVLPFNVALPLAGPKAPTAAPLYGEAAGGLEIFWALWAAGAGLMGLTLLFRAWLAHRQIRQARPLENRFCRAFIDGQGLRRKIELLICGNIGTPLTYGLLRPKILLPQRTDWQDEEGLACVLAHEIAHIRRLDVLRQQLIRGALCLHWFNPLVWALACLPGQDFEQACDEKALSMLGQGRKRRYALTLLNLAEQSRQAAPYGGLGLIGNNGLEERIGWIMNYQKLSCRTIAAAALAVAAATAVSAAELKPMEAGLEAVPAEVEFAARNSVEIDPAAATLKLEKEEGGAEYWSVTLEDGQRISYSLNHDHCDVEGGLVCHIDHNGSHRR